MPTRRFPDTQLIQALSCPIPWVMIGQAALQWLGPATFGVAGRLALPRGWSRIAGAFAYSDEPFLMSDRGCCCRELSAAFE